MAELLYTSLIRDLDDDDIADTAARWTTSDSDIIDTTTPDSAHIDEPGITVKATRGAPAEVTITHDDNAQDPPATLTFSFAPAEEGMADEIDGWSGTLLDLGPDSTDVMTIYTNIDATKGIPFGKKHLLTNGALILHDSTDGTDAAMDAGMPDGYINASAFTQANSIDHKYNEAGRYVSHMGTYQGAEGSYQCTHGDVTGDSCTSRINNDGKIVLGGTNGTWVFVPAPGAEAMVADSVYLHFGWWLREYTNPATVATEMVYGSTTGSVYAPLDADGAATPAAFNAVTGTATFEGNAAGKYALVDELHDTAVGGHWTADASLTAKFGSVDSAAVIDVDLAPGSISGEITNFSVGDDWKVTLWSTPLLANEMGPHFDTAALDREDVLINTYTARQDDGTLWSMGDRKATRTYGNGNWSGTLYVGDRSDGTPDGAAGEFAATFEGVGRMVGAFGVINVTPDTKP